jgi:hypothetical protein
MLGEIICELVRDLSIPLAEAVSHRGVVMSSILGAFGRRKSNGNSTSSIAPASSAWWATTEKGLPLCEVKHFLYMSGIQTRRIAYPSLSR